MKPSPSVDPWLETDDLFHIFNWRDVFGNDHPVEVDLGAGDGSFIVALALAKPEKNFVAVERLLGRARKIAKAASRQHLHNLRVARIESSYFLRYMCSAESISVIHILFPDPWPKRRHAPNRLIQPEFLEAAHHVLMKNGFIKFATDHAEYFAGAQKCWANAPGWNFLGEWDSEHDPKTDFQLEFEKQGRPVYRASWIKHITG